ncbi:hypothetical protein, partial [Vibrio cholerae]|uniref:hypothetical protein n=1 Tax=Vibrio cholerae TaxID=666 RepID=UPI0018F0A3A6
MDFSTVKKSPITYLPPEELEPLSSFSVWADVTKHIIANDMDKADEAKKIIEQQQRDRLALMKQNGKENDLKYFS